MPSELRRAGCRSEGALALTAARSPSTSEPVRNPGGVTAAAKLRRVVADAHRPSLVSWNLTRRCNLRCPHCYLSAGKKEEAELETAECLSLVEELRALGTEMVILTGGEPLLRKDVFEIASAASAAGMWVVMGTNGVLLDDRVAEKMIECGVKGVGISLDSLDPAKHDAFRGGPNAWRHSVRGLEVAVAHGLEVLVQTTVMDFNRDEIPKMIDFARAKGAWSFNLYFLVQTGRGQLLNDLSAEDTEELLGQLVDAQDAARPMLVRSKCAPQFKRLAYERATGGMESGGCMAGTTYCRITPSGDVTPCPYMDAVAGNVRERSFTDIWRHSELFGGLRDPERLEGRCGACEYRDLCGGCRCRGYAATGSVFAEDPACPHRPSGERRVLGTIEWSRAARKRLERIPIRFIRSKVETGLEELARSRGVPLVDERLMEEGLAGAARRPFGAGPPTDR